MQFLKTLRKFYYIFAAGFLFPTVAFAVEIENPIKANNFEELLTKIFQAIAALVGGISAIMVIVAGIFYLTSAGRPEKIKQAKDTLTYAIMGLAIALLAEAIIGAIKQVLG